MHRIAGRWLAEFLLGLREPVNSIILNQARRDLRNALLAEKWQQVLSYPAFMTGDISRVALSFGDDRVLLQEPFGSFGESLFAEDLDELAGFAAFEFAAQLEIPVFGVVL